MFETNPINSFKTFNAPKIIKLREKKDRNILLNVISILQTRKVKSKTPFSSYSNFRLRVNATIICLFFFSQDIKKREKYLRDVS